MELTGVLSVVNEVTEDRTFMAVVFSTKLINENIKYKKNEILDAQWFDIDDVINNMDDKLRNIKFIKHAVKNLKNREITSLNIINVTN